MQLRVDQDLPATAVLPTFNFSVRQLNSIYWPGDKRTYLYFDICKFTDRYYPDSYTGDIGVYSSADGRSDWTYHGPVLRRGLNPGDPDFTSVATPGVAVTNKTVLLSYTAESSDPLNRSGTRWIGLARSTHPLGPFVKSDRWLGEYGPCHV